MATSQAVYDGSLRELDSVSVSVDPHAVHELAKQSNAVRLHGVQDELVVTGLLFGWVSDDVLFVRAVTPMPQLISVQDWAAAPDQFQHVVLQSLTAVRDDHPFDKLTLVGWSSTQPDGIDDAYPLFANEAVAAFQERLFRRRSDVALLLGETGEEQLPAVLCSKNAAALGGSTQQAVSLALNSARSFNSLLGDEAANAAKMSGRRWAGGSRLRLHLDRHTLGFAAIVFAALICLVFYVSDSFFQKPALTEATAARIPAVNESLPQPVAATPLLLQSEVTPPPAADQGDESEVQALRARNRRLEAYVSALKRRNVHKRIHRIN